MNRKLATLSLGILGLMFVLSLTTPALATFSEDSMILRGTTDITSDLDTRVGAMFLAGDTGLRAFHDMAVDDSGQMYFLHYQTESATTETSIFITKTDHNGNFIKIITVDDTLNVPLRMMAIAVNRKSQAIYVVTAQETVARFYYDTGPQSNTRFVSDTIPSYNVSMDSKFGSIDIAVFGATIFDSVFVVGVTDTPIGSNNGVADSGVMLWRYTCSGVFSDTKQLYSRNDTFGATKDTGRMGRENIPSRVYIEAIDTDKIAVITIGRAPKYRTLESVGFDTGLYGMYYDTFQITSGGTLFADSFPDTIASGFGAQSPVDSVAAVVMQWDTFNNRVVIYYALRASSTKLRRAYVSGFGAYSSSSDISVSDNFSIDTQPSALALRIQKLTGASVKEHLAYRSRGNGVIHYIKREADATTGNVEIDTVAASRDIASGPAAAFILADSLPLGIGLSTAGAPRIAYERRQNNVIYINLASPQGAPVSASSGVDVVSSQTVSSATTVTVTVAPTVSDSAAQLTQIALTVAVTTPKTTLTDFTSPMYEVSQPLGNSFGDTLTVQINSTTSGMCVYTRRPLDTNPTDGTLDGSTVDTSNLGLTDSLFTACAATMVKIRMGDTLGNVFSDGAISETLALRLRFDITPLQLAQMNAYGVDTRNLVLWLRKSGESKFTQIGASTPIVATTLNGGAGVFFISNTFTSFSSAMAAPAQGGGDAGGGGICVVGKCIDSSSPTAGAIRSIRDSILSTKVGRVLTSLYYRIK